MQPSFNKLNYLVGDAGIISAMPGVRALPTFSPMVMEFLASLSKAMLQDKRTREYPDLSDYGFWIRKASLEKMRSVRTNVLNKIGRGVSLHIAPSNVPIAFAMSFTAALLAGNTCIVRVSSKYYPQVEVLTEAVNGLLQDSFAHLAPYLCLVRYEHDPDITQALTDLCDVRLIWGGNSTIGTIRKAILPPRAIELAFADRHSIAVINADEYLRLDAGEVAESFYLDTYYIDQGACSSPRLVVWMGENVEAARERFWEALAGRIADYDLRPIQAIDKYTAFCEYATGHKAHLLPGDNMITRVEVEKLTADMMRYKEGGGYYFEYTAKDLSELLPVLDKACQTITCIGIDPKILRDFIQREGVRGGDRIVPAGKSMRLTLMWDGFDLVDTMSRYIALDEQE